jgi:fibronectin-binding autotransporter adhesin
VATQSIRSRALTSRVNPKVGVGALGPAASGGTASTFVGNGTIGELDRLYQVLKFTSSGTLTVTKAGYFDFLIVSGGSGGGGEYAADGAGGGISSGQVWLEPGSYTVTVGAGSTTVGATATGNPGGIGGFSRLGPLTSGLAAAWSTPGPNAPLTSTITGTSVTYGQAGQTSVVANTGNGGDNALCCSGRSGIAGASGIVVVRYEI